MFQLAALRPSFTLLPGLLLALTACTSEAPRPAIVPTPPPPTPTATTYTFTELAFSDEFNTAGLPDPAKWTYETGGSGWGNNELQYYTASRSENARIENGNLVIEARKDGMGGRDYTSVRLNSRPAGGGTLTYGRVEVRAKLPAGRGTWPAIWMMPDNSTYGGWPDSGEIDIMEHVGYDPGVVHATTHCNKYYFKVGNQKSAQVRVNDFDTAFHTYAIQWTPETITAELDGQTYFTVNNERTGWQAWPFDKPFHLLLNIAVGGDWGGAKGVDTSIFPKQMLVDYVRFYKMKAQ